LSCLLALAALAPAAWAAPPGVTPCVWHVRLDYHYRDAGTSGAHDTRVLLALDTPMRCAGSGLQTIVIPGGPALARGSVHVHRNVPHPGADPALRDISDKTAAWPAASGPAPAAEAPEPSFVGTGFGARLVVDAAPAGPVRSGVAEAAGAAPAGAARGLTTQIDPPAEAGPLHLELFFDPAPGEPADPAGALARVPERTREALAAPGGEAALALKGHFFGALTQTTGDGDFSVCYRRTLALAPTNLDVDFCGWLTRGPSDWSPPHLPAVDTQPEK
jgi:hypothetical protein